MSSKSATTLPIGQICISPFNVRKAVPTEENTTAIEASILVEGLRVPIDVHHMRGSKTQHGAFAGRRRLYAIKRLVERGALPADWPVPVQVFDGFDEAELVEMSITENLIREDMNDPELWAGVALAAAKGHSVEEISKNLGQNDPRKVSRWLRLGRLAKPIFAALVEGAIDDEAAMAYAATEDQDLQLAVFEQLRGSHATPAMIRRTMKIGDHQLRVHLSFVGEAIYRAAGGRYELDLFAEAAQDRGRIVDEGILARLVEEKLATIRDEVRVKTQRRDLRFIPRPPQTAYDLPDHQLMVTPKKRGDHLELPDGDVVAHIEIAGDEHTVGYWWASRKAKFGSEKPTAGRTVSAATAVPRAAIGDAIADPYHARPRADAALREDEGLSADGTQIMRSMRKMTLRAILVADARAGGDVARDYLAWAQARAIFGGFPRGKLGMARLPAEDTVGMTAVLGTVRTHLTAMPAQDTLRAALDELQRHPSMTGEDLAAGFLAFRAAPERFRCLAAAIATGMALERSLNAGGYDSPVHDAIAAEAGAADDAEVRRHWSPTREWLDLFPKAQRLAIATEAVPEEVRRRWPTLKSPELSAELLRALPADWVHPLLHFDAGAGRAVADQPEMAEAAE